MSKEVEEKVQLNYEISGNTPPIIIEGNALTDSSVFIENSLLELGRGMARRSIGEVPHMVAKDLKRDNAIAEALSKVEVDDPNFKDLDPATDQGIFNIGAIVIAKAEAAKESLTSPKAKAKLTGFEKTVAKKISKALYRGTSLGLAVVLAACGIRTVTPTTTPEVTLTKPTVREVTPTPSFRCGGFPELEVTEKPYDGTVGGLASLAADCNAMGESKGTLKAFSFSSDIKLPPNIDISKVKSIEGVVITINGLEFQPFALGPWVDRQLRQQATGLIMVIPDGHGNASGFSVVVPENGFLLITQDGATDPLENYQLFQIVSETPANSTP